MNAMKLRLLLFGAIIMAIGAARVAIGGLGDAFVWLLPVGAILVVVGLVWK
jgi:hypothetical protein